MLRGSTPESLLIIRSVQSLSRVQLFATLWTAARHASLSITISRSLLKLMSIESVMPSNHLILCCPLLLSPSIFPSIRVFSNESALHIRWPRDWSFSLSISPSNEYSGFVISGARLLPVRLQLSHMPTRRTAGRYACTGIGSIHSCSTESRGCQRQRQ